MYPHIALDSKDYPHIGYKDPTKEDLKYTRRDASSWNVEDAITLHNH